MSEVGFIIQLKINFYKSAIKRKWQTLWFIRLIKALVRIGDSDWESRESFYLTKHCFQLIWVSNENTDISQSEFWFKVGYNLPPNNESLRLVIWTRWFSCWFSIESFQSVDSKVLDKTNFKIRKSILENGLLQGFCSHPMLHPDFRRIDNGAVYLLRHKRPFGVQRARRWWALWFEKINQKQFTNIFFVTLPQSSRLGRHPT